ncbi:tRNA (5-methylaminomethyl-2-thiouridylate)-methyltransferase [Legionella jamestowniensis]|uniref:tRNA (5-methylaminomethyl-2-thiouridylate)-methyltransferase n=1 Tax=Legionella jamestowniensis TaxID=455 RepID=A0A0W0ULB0_9GAMM|nr:tRNA (5-methylaminomethyl-2-thiouridylate)-methyltransferase [Legionella jamestowniensis]KTD08503.1 tRNA-specific 2-thiouridylase MnmA [Legionella jamestowniensis]OCH97033.1 tRNA (5-methylaminomethyl-2-thiouridylate)-methyltransferase [Legionella jamestowniensis]SFL52098.1 tRNA U34 2-thiouridine synthase MnmA/TrmU, contains the PP-loop ATPase domain [Legionella jamestowniensis DSM 19215]
MSSKRKAVALISGGLDSMLAVKVVQEQGIHVEGINFYTGFCHSGHTSAIRNRKTEKPLRNDALWVAEQLGIQLHIIDIVEPYKEILLNPKHGYGKNVNPCLDCKIFMVQEAYKWMLENNFDFIITGEVVGQRPKSQRSATMPLIAEKSGAEDRLLRPLCAKLLPPTLPEREGWVNRETLYDFRGRNRKPQLGLAASMAIDEFAQPAGGCCVLTDDNYTRRLRDMWEHRTTRDYDLEDIILLKAGRHIRPLPHYKMIIARDEAESNFLTGYRKQFTHMLVRNHRGPMILIEGQPEPDDFITCARIAGRFCSGREEVSVEVELHHLDGQQQVLTVQPLRAEEIPQAWYL